MKYKTLDEQLVLAIDILKKNDELMKILDYIEEMELPNFYIVAGSIYQTIWNYCDGRPLNNGNKDLDIVYFDLEHLDKEYEASLEKKLRDFFEEQGLNYEFDLHNEARMHLWKKDNENPYLDHYESSEQAINIFAVTVQAVGLTKRAGEMRIYAPYGLSDIFSKTVRPIKHANAWKDYYDKKVESWSHRFEGLNIVEW